MLVVMHKQASPREIAAVVEAVESMGLQGRPIPGAQRVAIGVTGNKSRVDVAKISSLDNVVDIIHVTKPYKLASREMKEEDTLVKAGPISIGGLSVAMIAGPCAVESREMLMEAAHAAKAAGASVLRGGAFKPRTSPYAFQGLGEEGLKILADAREATGLPVVSEVTDKDFFDMAEEYVDVIQIGARNMQNYPLLTKAGKSRRPILLKRGISATVTEFLLAAEYIISEGNQDVILCERGVRTFSDHSRFTLDISAVPELKRITHLPVIVDPSHASGKRFMVGPMARAAVAAGADGIMIEIHPDPGKALCDGAHSLPLDMFADLMKEIETTASAIGRSLTHL